MARPRRVGSGNQYRKLATTKLPKMRQQRGTGQKRRSSGSHNSKQYQEKRNAVRKAQTRLKALQEAQTKTGTPAASKRVQSEIDRLSSQIERTRTYSKETGKRIRSKEEVGVNVLELERLNKEFDVYVRGSGKARQRRLNEITATNINQASLKNPTNETPYTKDQVHIFYRATQKAWQNAPLEERNQAIMDYYGATSLSDLFEQVVNDKRNQDVQRAKQLIGSFSATDEEKAWAMDVLSKGDNGDSYVSSPPDAPSDATEEDINPVYAPS